MKITYDPQADAMYIYLNKHSIASTASVTNNLIIDYDKKKVPVGIEMLSVSKMLPKRSLNSVKIQILSDLPKKQKHLQK